MKTFNFTAIDFETMTAERTSACAIGLVRVENGVLLQKFYSLIRPIPDNRPKDNSDVHGITKAMLEHAPTFKELWPVICGYIDGAVIVAHNADFDIDVLNKTASAYGIDFSLSKVIDTYSITHHGLAESCALAQIPLENHHDALCDATACARVMLACMGIRYEEHHYEKMSAESRRKRELSSDAKAPLDEKEIVNKETPFYQKKVVITGIIDAYPMREELAQLLKQYGADINSSISGKTNIVIVGHGAGPSKMKKIEDLNSNGAGIQIIYEPEFLEILEKYNIK